MATIMKGEALFAPVGPFVVAISEWQVGYRKRPPGIRDPRRRPRAPRRTDGMEELSRTSGIPARRLRAYQTGESQWIHIDNADRLCIALDVALWMLAEDFKTMQAWRREEKA